MSGVTPVATEAALSLASRIAGDPSLSEELTWYIMPIGNPDAYSRYFSRPLYSDPANAEPYNEDNDDQTDEDGYNDLDGNGIEFTAAPAGVVDIQATCSRTMPGRVSKPAL